MASSPRPDRVRTSCAQPRTPNGSSASSDEVQALRAEVEELRQLLWAQQRALESTTPTSADGARGFLRTGDRRAEGLFDTRFHSASRSVMFVGLTRLPARLLVWLGGEGKGMGLVEQGRWWCWTASRMRWLSRGAPAWAWRLMFCMTDRQWRLPRRGVHAAKSTRVCGRGRGPGADSRLPRSEPCHRSGATPPDYRMLPLRIVLIRHAESEGNVDNVAYTYLPDNKVPLTRQGWDQALRAGERLGELCRGDAAPPRLFFYTSPYLRSKQTYEAVAEAFPEDAVLGCQEEVQLREQDFGNFQDLEGKQREKAERLRFGRFFYRWVSGPCCAPVCWCWTIVGEGKVEEGKVGEDSAVDRAREGLALSTAEPSAAHLPSLRHVLRFPNGESGADVYDRMTIFEDHLVRDINAGRFGTDCTLVLVTHGLALRIFLMRWFHWTVDEFLRVFNPPNAEPLVLERIVHGAEARPGGAASWMHTKARPRGFECVYFAI